MHLKSPVDRGRGDCEHQMAVLEFSLSPLEEVLLTNEPPLQPSKNPFYGPIPLFHIYHSPDCMKTEMLNQCELLLFFL